MTKKYINKYINLTKLQTGGLFRGLMNFFQNPEQQESSSRVKPISSDESVSKEDIFGDITLEKLEEYRKFVESLPKLFDYIYNDDDKKFILSTKMNNIDKIIVYLFDNIFKSYIIEKNIITDPYNLLYTLLLDILKLFDSYNQNDKAEFICEEFINIYQFIYNVYKNYDDYKLFINNNIELFKKIYSLLFTLINYIFEIKNYIFENLKIIILLKFE